VTDRGEWLTIYESGAAVVASGLNADEIRCRVESAVRAALKEEAVASLGIWLGPRSPKY
jgi:hypothetical protein